LGDRGLARQRYNKRRIVKRYAVILHASLEDEI
jgi:hypothetical protein